MIKQDLKVKIWTYKNTFCGYYLDYYIFNNTYTNKVLHNIAFSKLLVLCFFLSFCIVHTVQYIIQNSPAQPVRKK